MKSTGPRSLRGKFISSQNARKTGYYSSEMKAIRAYLRFNGRLLRYIRAAHPLFSTHTKPKNELSSKQCKWRSAPLRFPHKVFKNGDIFTTDRQ